MLSARTFDAPGLNFYGKSGKKRRFDFEKAAKIAKFAPKKRRNPIASADNNLKTK